MKLGDFLNLFDRVLKSDDRELKRVPRLILGPPGIGKTSGLRAVARANGYDFHQVLLSRMRPEHLEGVMVPVTEAEYKGYRVSKKALTDLYRKATSSEKVVILFDELNTAPPDLQNAALTILTDFEIGGKKLENDVVFVAAGNTISSGTAYVEQLKAVMSTRFMVYYVDADISYLIETGLIKKLYHPTVVAYLLANPNDFFVPSLVDIVGDGTAPQFTSPRGWERISKILSKIELNPDSSFTKALFVGTLGPAGERFFEFWQKYDSTIKKLLKERISDDIPEELKPFASVYITKRSKGNETVNVDKAAG